MKRPTAIEKELAEQLEEQKAKDKHAAEVELQRINLERKKIATLKLQS